MASNLLEDRVLAQRPRLHEACLKLHGMAQELGPEAKLPTMVQLRTQFGISLQILQDAVRELEKRSILYSVRGVGIYVVSQRSRRQTGNIGFVAPRSMPPSQDVSYWGALLAGMREAAREGGCHLLLIDDGESFDHWSKIDGAIVCNTDDPRDAAPVYSQPPRGFPHIAILNQMPTVPSVTVDDFEGSYRLTKHLLELGHRKIAYMVSFNADLSLLKQRKQGYLKALKDAGIQPEECFMREIRKRSEWENSNAWYREGGEYCIRQWLYEGWQELGCTALVAQNDDAALGAIKAFQAAGLQVPDDVSVTGFDGVITNLPQLTTVKVPLFDIGLTATRLLLEWLDDPQQAPDNLSLPVQFVAGETSALAPIDV